MNGSESVFLPLLLFPLLIFSIFAFIIFLIVRFYKNAARQREELAAWVAQRGYTPIVTAETGDSESWINTLKQSYKVPQIFSSQYAADATFNKGLITSGFLGVLPSSKNDFGLFLQAETRGSGKSRRVYHRTILKANIPDTKLQMIINSKINNDYSSGGNIGSYSKGQRYELEGEFGTFFELFMPSTTQSETLSVLTPDSMLYIMTNLADYDIEINGTTLYLYTYKHLKINEFDDIIAKLDALLEETRLRKNDVRTSKHADALVARTATHVVDGKRNLKKDFQLLGIVGMVGFFVFQVVGSATNSTWFPIVFTAVVVIFIIKAIVDGVKNERLKKKYMQVVQSYQKR